MITLETEIPTNNLLLETSIVEILVLEKLIAFKLVFLDKSIFDTLLDLYKLKFSNNRLFERSIEFIFEYVQFKSFKLVRSVTSKEVIEVISRYKSSKLIKYFISSTEVIEVL